MADFWLTHAKLITPRGITSGALKVSQGRIAAIRRSAPRGARTISVRGSYLAPGFIDLHVWGPPDIVSRDAARAGTTSFLTTLGPEPPRDLLRHAVERTHAEPHEGAVCVGLHLEGPFVNPARAGALPKRWMRVPTASELDRVARAAAGRLKMMTIAPELRGADAAIRWCRRHRVVASLGHSTADANTAYGAVDAGASAVTHVFNGMQPLHHRDPSLLNAALTDDRVTTMVIADGVHVGHSALRLLLQAKGPQRIALVTDSIRRQGWQVTARSGAYYTRRGVLAGSCLTMIEAVKRMATACGVPLADAIRMASEVPARLLRLGSRGALRVGARADLVIFDRTFRVRLTLVGGRLVYQRRGS
ncbi:MAG: N-acetylglucosamine-6-phosphate deacetylase [Candidatus Omnitrophica bacterium]|nr:N-acetylglucosamine-6-phosphate deacetylase [Candidatus Omnitrophota bacterium]